MLKIILSMMMLVSISTYAQDTWTIQNIGDSLKIYDISVTNPNNYYITSSEGKILKSSNNGISWDKIENFTNYELFSISLLKDGDIWLAGFDLVGKTGKTAIFKKNQQNNEWKSSIINSMYIPIEIHPVDSLNAIIGLTSTNDYFIKGTADGGENWYNIYKGVNSRLACLQFLDSNRFWFCGSEGNLFLSVNDEVTSYKNSELSKYDLFEVFFVNSNTGYISGSKGAVFKSIDFGKSWILSNNGIDKACTIYSLYFTDEEHGWACGTNLTSSKGVIYSTKNGGLLWELDLSVDNRTFINIVLSSTNELWAYGANVLYKKDLSTSIDVNNEQYKDIHLDYFNNVISIINQTNFNFSYKLNIFDLIGREILSTNGILDFCNEIKINISPDLRLTPKLVVLSWENYKKTILIY